MEKFNIILEDGTQKEVDCLFYLYNSRYYFIYTEKEIDENGYVILHIVQVGKETQNTPAGPMDTGNMIGLDIVNSDENTIVQNSITRLVEDKKNGTQSPEIKYLPLSMLTNLKIVSKKTFRLLKDLVNQCFDINLDLNNSNLQIATVDGMISNGVENYSDVIINYRSKFFEEETKNKELLDKNSQLEEKVKALEEKIQTLTNSNTELNEKINNIKKMIE